MKPLKLLLAALLLCGCNPSVTTTPGNNSTPATVTFDDGSGAATLFFYETNGVRLAVLVGFKKCALVQIK